MKVIRLFNFRVGVLHFIALLIFILTAAPAMSGSLIIDVKGHAAGQLSRFGLENKNNRAFNEAFAGEIQLGHESASFISFGSLPQGLVTNPFRF